MGHLGNLIKKYRSKHEVSQMELAEDLGYTTPQFISNCERGLCSLPIAAAKKLSKKLKIPHLEIIEAMESDWKDRFEKEWKRKPRA